MIADEQALVSSRPTPIKSTPVGINIVLFAKIIIEIWILAGDSKRVRSIVMRLSSKSNLRSGRILASLSYSLTWVLIYLL